MIMRKHLCIALVVASIAAGQRSASAAEPGLAGWRDYRLGMSQADFTAVRPAACQALAKADPATLKIPDADKDKIIPALSEFPSGTFVCRVNALLRTSDMVQYSVIGYFVADRLAELVVRGAPIANTPEDANRLRQEAPLILRRAVRRYGTPSFSILAEMADWHFADSSALSYHFDDPRREVVLVFYSPAMSNLAEFK